MRGVEHPFVLQACLQVGGGPTGVAAGQGHVASALVPRFVDDVAFVIPAAGEIVGLVEDPAEHVSIFGIPAEFHAGLEAFGDEFEVLGEGHQGLGHDVGGAGVTGTVEHAVRVVASVRIREGSVREHRRRCDWSGVHRVRINVGQVLGRSGLGVVLGREGEGQGSGLGDVNVHIGAETELVETHLVVVAHVLGVLGNVEDTVFLIIGGTHVVAYRLVSSGHVHVDAVGAGHILENGLDPVHGRIEVRIRTAQVHLPCVFVDGRLASAVNEQLVVVVNPLLGVGEFRKFYRLGDTVLGLEADLRLGFATSLGGDEHDSVCTSHTVEGGCGCVLEDGEGSDVIHIYKVHGTFHTIHDNQRGAVGSEGVHASNPEVGTCSRLTGALH